MAKVTVLMPTYNVAPWVEEAIRSVLRQTYRDFELLVVDDASTDNTLDVVRTIDDPRIRIASFPDNVGLSKNLNRGLDLIDTEYFARMDGDDIALPHWLQSEIDYLDAHPEVGVCGGGGQRFGTSQSLIRFPEQHDDIAANMLFECTIIVPTVRMSVVRQHGLRYRKDAFPAEDYRFWADCLRVTRLHNIPDTLFRYRMHASQICSSRRQEQESKVAEVRLYMLDWLSPDFTNDEKLYHTRDFTAPQIASRQDLYKRKSHSRRLVEQSRSLGHLPQKVLRQSLDRRLTITLYNTIVGRFFSDGYSLLQYIHYLASGLAWHTGFKYESKFLLKSIFRRPI